MERKEDCFHLGAKALLQNTEGKLLLLQKNPKEPPQNVECLWDLPGGRINRGESLEEALKREVFEETGLNSMTQIESFTMVLSDSRIPLQEGDVGLIYAVYLCHILDENPTIQLSDEHLRSIWVSPREAAGLLKGVCPAQLINKISQLQKETYETTKI